MGDFANSGFAIIRLIKLAKPAKPAVATGSCRWYLFDKLLHNDYVLKPERLGPAELKILVALAEPARTISSIVHLFRQKPAPDLYASPVEAAHYWG